VQFGTDFVSRIRFRLDRLPTSQSVNNYIWTHQIRVLNEFGDSSGSVNYVSRVLVLHDPNEPLSAVRRALGDAGVTIDTADGVAAAVRRLESSPADCVVGPYGLAGDEGLSVLSELRAEYDVPAVLMVDDESFDVVNRATAAGITATLLARPGDVEGVAGAIRRIVARRDVEAQRRCSAFRVDLEDVLARSTGASTREELERAICRSLSESGNYAAAWVCELDRETGRLVPRTAVGLDAAALGDRPAAPVREADERVLVSADDAGATTTATIPLSRDGTPFGTLHLSTARSIGGPERRRLAALGEAVSALVAAASDRPDGQPDVEVLTGTISHELRNYLQIAGSNLTFAREAEGDPDEREEYFDQVSRALDRIETLADEAALIGGSEIRESHVTDVALEEVASVAWNLVGASRMSMTVVDSTTVRAHRSLLQVLLENLFRNSVEHAGCGTIRVGALDDGFYVEDTGPGIPSADRDRVFEWGYTTAADGTGIGLGLVDRIANAHGWEVAATSGDEGGARFEVRDG
jgi:signal transduction histidine kinase